MSIVEFNGGRITHKYLMGKTKSELARMYLDLLDCHEYATFSRDEAYRDIINLMERLAPKLGFTSFPISKDQSVWAKNKEQADSLRLGESVYRFVREELLGENNVK